MTTSFDRGRKSDNNAFRTADRRSGLRPHVRVGIAAVDDPGVFELEGGAADDTGTRGEDAENVYDGSSLGATGRAEQ